MTWKIQIISLFSFNEEYFHTWTNKQKIGPPIPEYKDCWCIHLHNKVPSE